MFIDLRKRGRGGGKKGKRERNIDRLPPVWVPTGDQTCKPGMCPDWELGWQLCGVWDNAPTELPAQGTIQTIFN